MIIIYSSKFKHRHEIAFARHKLSTEYRLADNVDVLFGFADSLFADYRYADCFAITSRLRFSSFSLRKPMLTVPI